MGIKWSGWNLHGHKPVNGLNALGNAMKLFRVLSILVVLLAALGGIWFWGFNRNISLPNPNRINKIEVCQNDFKQRAQQISYIEEQPKILKIYEFIDKRKEGWEPLLYTAPTAVVIANFYDSDKLLFRLYLMKTSNFLIRNNDGAYMKSLRNEEREEFFKLLGVQTDRMVFNHSAKNSL